MSKRIIKDISFSDFLSSLDNFADPVLIERLKKLGPNYEQIPVSNRPDLIELATTQPLIHVVNLLEKYEPGSDFFYTYFNAPFDNIKNDRVAEKAQEIGLKPLDLEKEVRRNITQRREPLFLEEGLSKERFFDSSKGNKYKVPTRMVVFFDGESLRLGIKSPDPFPRGVWTQRDHSFAGEDWEICDNVPIVRKKEPEIFHKGILPALRARALADLLTYFPHNFQRSLDDCVRLALASPESLKSNKSLDFSVPLSICYGEGNNRIKKEDPRIRETVLGIPEELERSLKRLKSRGYFFEPFEIIEAYKSLEVSMSKELTSLIKQEETSYKQSATGIRANPLAIEEAILCKQGGRDLLNFFHTLVSSEDTDALVQVLQGSSPQDTKEGYFLIGRNNGAEVTLSYTRNSILSKNKVYSPIQKLKWLNSRFTRNFATHKENDIRFLEGYHPDWVGAISIESDSQKYLANQDAGPLNGQFRNSFCLSIPIEPGGINGDFILCQDKKYYPLFVTMAQDLSNLVSSPKEMPPMIGVNPLGFE